MSDFEKLEYYKRELSYLMKKGKEFAHQYPQVAHSLGIDINDYQDPHLKKLTQSFAFLTSRLNYKIDTQFERITSQLLSMLFPYHAHPMPSCNILQFTSPIMHQLIGVQIPQASVLTNEEGITVQTAWEVKLNNISINDVFIDLDSMTETTLALNLSNVPKGDSDFYLNLGYEENMKLFRFLFEKSAQNYDFSNSQTNPTSKIFIKTKTEVIPSEIKLSHKINDLYSLTPYTNTQLNLLHTFMGFYKNFMFFTLSFPENYDNVQLLINMPKASQSLELNRTSILTNCVSVFNLFDKPTVPIKVQPYQDKYLITPIDDNSNVHSINYIKTFDQSHPSYMENDQTWTSFQDKNDTYICLTSSLNQTIGINAKHYNIKIKEASRDFMLENHIAGLKAKSLNKFTSRKAPSASSSHFLIKLLHLQYINLFQQEHVQQFLQNLIDIHSYLNTDHIGINHYVTNIQSHKTALYKQINNIWCAFPVSMFNIQIQDNDRAFVFAYILGHTLKRLAPIGMEIEFNITTSSYVFN